jgi:hypothetical protein
MLPVPTHDNTLDHKLTRTRPGMLFCSLHYRMKLRRRVRVRAVVVRVRVVGCVALDGLVQCRVGSEELLGGMGLIGSTNTTSTTPTSIPCSTTVLGRRTKEWAIAIDRPEISGRNPCTRILYHIMHC